MQDTYPKVFVFVIRDLLKNTLMKETQEFISRFLTKQDRPVSIEPIAKIPLEGDRAMQNEEGFP